jgi:DNA topoisomerase VI subunit B
MLSTMSRHGAFAVLVVFLGTAAAQEPAKPPSQEEVSSTASEREDMRREVEEAARAIEAYSIARRDEAQQRAKAAIETTDRQIQQLQADLERGAERMSAAARANRERAIADLRAQSAELSARYRRMQDSSADAWSRIRDEFVNAYRRITEAVRKASADSDAQKPAEEKPAEESEPSP